jgi:hypothetical protein
VLVLDGGVGPTGAAAEGRGGCVGDSLSLKGAGYH